MFNLVTQSRLTVIMETEIVNSNVRLGKVSLQYWRYQFANFMKEITAVKNVWFLDFQCFQCC
jgi:hypothetical protein